MLLFNIFNNRFNDIVNSSNKKDIINCLKKNTTSFQLPITKRNKVFNYSKIEKKRENAN